MRTYGICAVLLLAFALALSPASTLATSVPITVRAHSGYGQGDIDSTFILENPTTLSSNGFNYTVEAVCYFSTGCNDPTSYMFLYQFQNIASISSISFAGVDPSNVGLFTCSDAGDGFGNYPASGVFCSNESLSGLSVTGNSGPGGAIFIPSGAPSDLTFVLDGYFFSESNGGSAQEAPLVTINGVTSAPEPSSLVLLLLGMLALIVYTGQRARLV